MNGHDQFEQRLQRRPPAQLPPSWRAEILAAARAEAASPPASETTVMDRLTSLRQTLTSWLWPHPAAWATLAALWVLALGLNLATREPSRLEIARRPPPPSPELRRLLKEQGQLFAELVGPIEKPDSLRPRPAAAQPRSQRRLEFMNA